MAPTPPHEESTLPTSAPPESDPGGGSIDHDLFISYASPDREFVLGQLVPSLGLAPSRIILSERFRPGEAIIAEFERAIERSRYTVVVLSPAYLSDPWAAFGEVLASFASVAASRLIPLVLAECKLPLRIAFRVSLDFRQRERWEEETSRLRDLLALPTPALERPSGPSPGIQASIPDRRHRLKWLYARWLLPFVGLGLLTLGLWLYSATRQGVPVQAAGIALAGRWRDLPGTYSTYQALCAALVRDETGSARCPLAALVQRAPEQTLANTHDAALVVWLQGSGTVLLHPREPLIFPLGAIHLSGDLGRPSGTTDAWRYLTWVLRGVSEMAAEGPPGAPPTPPPFVGPEQVGEDVTVLGAFVRWYQRGEEVPTAEVLKDSELTAIQRRVQQCQRGTPGHWICPMASFLLAFRCPSCTESRQILDEMASTALVSNRTWVPRIQLARQLCQRSPLQAAQLLSGFRPIVAREPCLQLRLMAVATCTALAKGAEQIPADSRSWLAQMATASPPLQADCPHLNVAIALGERGLWLMRARRFAAAAEDSRRAYALDRHPSYLLNWAASLLHLDERRQEVLDVLSLEKIKLLPDARTQLQAVFYRWFVSRGPLDAGALQTLYHRLPESHIAIEDEPTFPGLFCAMKSEPTCGVYRILVAPRVADSTARLATLLRAGASD